MQYSNGLIISTAALAILTTGCVKKPTNDTVVYDNSQPVYNNTQPVYDNSQPVYEDATPLIYDSSINNTSTSGVVYSDTPTDSTVITTDTYNPAPVIVDTTYTEQPASTPSYPQTTTSYPQATDTYSSQPESSGTGAYNNSYGNDAMYPDPYASQSASSSSSSYPDPYATATSSYPSSSSSSTSSSQGGGIHLQIAALKDYYAAQEFKNSLSLDPKYSAYVKRGAINKVIISGISSVSEANRLKERRFPGAFIVQGGSLYSSSSNSSSNSSSYSYETNYTVNNPYGTTSSSTNYSGNSNGIGVQVGAFSSKSKAQSIANSASSKYRGIVKSGRSNGKRIYKAILTGFSSESEARRFIANRGEGFLVHGL
jgi:cell division septation protein DedD